jgi:hypothetical protein
MRPRYLLSLICVLLVVLIGAASAEEEFVFQYGLDGYEDTKDTHVTEYTGNNGNNMGGNIENECCEYDPANTDGKSVLVWFDVSSIPRNAVVNEATLEMYMTSTRNGTNDKEVAAHRLLKDWAEGTGTGIDGRAATNEEVCGRWTGVDGEEWTTVGADEPGEDFVAEPEDTIEIGGDTGQWYIWDVTEACQYWIRNPDENFGLILLEPRPHAQTLGTKVFAAKENSNPDIYPRLIVMVGALSVSGNHGSKLATCWGMLK